MTNDRTRTALSAGEPDALPERLLPLLAEQAARYTMGESSSLPRETAERLLGSLCFCLGVSPCGGTRRQGPEAADDLRAEYRRGLARVRAKTQYAERLWLALCDAPPPVENEYFSDTMGELGRFFRRYDPVFFAREIPCSIDYPPAIPVSETQEGINYVLCYLRRLTAETGFLRLYGADAADRVLRRHCPEYRHLPENLFEPVFSAALGLTLLERPDDSLCLRGEDPDALGLLLEPLRRAEIEALLTRAVGRLLTRHGLSDSRAAAYFRACAGPLAARLFYLRDCGGLGGVFAAEPRGCPSALRPANALSPAAAGAEAAAPQAPHPPFRSAARNPR